MRIILLGTGAALPDPDRCHTSILLTLNNGRHFLLDCGHGATRQMMRVDVNPADVAHLLLTHLHHDHVCELPFFVISSWILSRPGALDIRGPKGTQESRKPSVRRRSLRRRYPGAVGLSGAAGEYRGRAAQGHRIRCGHHLRGRRHQGDGGSCRSHPAGDFALLRLPHRSGGQGRHLQRRHRALRRHRAAVARCRPADPRMHVHRGIHRAPAEIAGRHLLAHEPERARPTGGGVRASSI